MLQKIWIIIAVVLMAARPGRAQEIKYVTEMPNKNHPQIGYWFISPDFVADQQKISHYINDIAAESKYTLIFLTAREGANFYDTTKMHPVFKDLVAEAHRKGLQVGLQLWGIYSDTDMRQSQRMIVESEITLDALGRGSASVKAKHIRFPDRLLKTDLFRAYALKKTGEGFYEPGSVANITSNCSVTWPDKETVNISIDAGTSQRHKTVCLMIQQYCSQSSNWGNNEINRFVSTMKAYADIPFDGFALDEYGNKFVERIFDTASTTPFRGRWYSDAMAEAFRKETGASLAELMFDGRYAPSGAPEVRMSAINKYMAFMRKGPLRVERAVYENSRQIFGNHIFNGIHSAYHNSLVNDEIWANGLMWWEAPRLYGQTDEKTTLPVQMGVALAHAKNALYNQYYDATLEPVVVKSFNDLRYGVRTHYHAMNDKRPLRYDLGLEDARKAISLNERCTRLLNQFNPSLPDIKLLVIFGMEALSNWYPDYKSRGVYDINATLQIEQKAVEIWNAGYLNALVPSDLIVNGQLKLSADGKAILGGQSFDAVLYLNPQYAREPVIRFLEQFVNKGGKLMIEGDAQYDFGGNPIGELFKKIYDKAAVKGYQPGKLSALGLSKNLLPNGCKNADGSYIFNDLNSLRTGEPAYFEVKLNGKTYRGAYRGISLIKADTKGKLEKFTASGFTHLSCDGTTLLAFKKPVDVLLEKAGGKYKMTIVDETKKIEPFKNELWK